MLKNEVSLEIPRKFFVIIMDKTKIGYYQQINQLV